MDIEERYALVTRNSAELISEDELRAVLAEDRQPTAYIGFEPSGLVHMGWTLVAGKIRDLAEAGFKVTVFWADWHAYINDKLGGDLDRYSNFGSSVSSTVKEGDYRWLFPIPRSEYRYNEYVNQNPDWPVIAVE